MQKEKQQDYESFSSHQLLTTKDADIQKPNISYFSSESSLADKIANDDSYDESPGRYSDASFPATPSSNDNSSSGSFKTYSAYDGKGSMTPSSTIYEEIAVCPSVLLPYDDAEERFLEDNESYFLHLSVDNVRRDQYPDLELQRIVYLDYATCPLYSRFQV